MAIKATTVEIGPESLRKLAQIIGDAIPPVRVTLSAPEANSPTPDTSLKPMIDAIGRAANEFNGVKPKSREVTDQDIVEAASSLITSTGRLIDWEHIKLALEAVERARVK